MNYRNNDSLFNRIFGGQYCIVFCLCVFVFSLSPFAQNSNQTSEIIKEYVVKSFMLVRLTTYMEWPEEKGAGDVVITVLGGNPFGRLLEEQAKKVKYKDRDFAIRYADEISDIGPTHVLFINEKFRNQWSEIQDAVKDKHILTVSEYDGFANNGGIINFFIAADGTVNMEVNLKAAEGQQIKIGSQVLQLKKVKLIRD